MSDDGLTFGRRMREPRPGGAGGLLALLLVVALTVAASRSLWSPSVPDGSLVEVLGDVPRPGMHLVDPPTVGAAVAAAGGTATDQPDRPLEQGDRVVVEGGLARVLPPSDPLLVALPIDVNVADAEALAAIPGLGSYAARAIVEERETGGPFRSLEDLQRARGVGPDTLLTLGPFVTLSAAPPLDLNTATAEQLERLPGIGPVLAARIVVDRAEQGPFADTGDLVRVQGVGPQLVEALADLVVATP